MFRGYRGDWLLRWNSQPINLSTTAGFALCAVAFVRHLCYGVQKFMGSDSPVSEAQVIRGKLDIPEGDLIIPGGWLSDRMIVDNPVEWVNQKVQEYAKVEEG